MNFFSQEFKNQLTKTVSEIENNSQVEVVVIIKAISGNYEDNALKLGAILSFISFTLFMFLPSEFGSYLIYTGTTAAFVIPVILGYLSKSILRSLVSPKRMARNVEIMARAIFQKAGIYNTKNKIGVLIYGSLFEEKVYILPDRGAENSIPAEEWERITVNLTKILKNSDSGATFLSELKNCSHIFSKYIPPIENDINELPDNLEINL